jgi:ABC-type multidrug transport system fused ATPase/permease subunit
VARIVYRDADVMLLDDCLSAVDAHVGKELFDKCIIDVLLKKARKGSDRKRTVVLVTNALQYLSNPVVDRIVVMKDGRIVESGTYQQLAGKEGSHFRRYMRFFSQSMTNDNENSKAEETMEETDVCNFSSERKSPERRRSRKNSDGSVDIPKDTKLMTDEMAEREIGKVDKEVYRTWAKAAGGLWVVIPLFLVFAVGEWMKIFSNWWLTYWSHEATPDSDSQLKFLFIYALINVGAICVDFCRMFMVLFLGLLASSSVSAETCFNASQNKPNLATSTNETMHLHFQLFCSLLDSTLMAPMAFFDTTPAGRITNRFSKGKTTLVVSMDSANFFQHLT